MMMRMFPSDMHMQREGITAQFLARVASAPRARFTADGEPTWEFVVRVNDTWDTTGRTETVTVRVPDVHYAQLQKWVKPGVRMWLKGWLYLARWKSTKDGRDKVRMVVDAVELMPADTNGRSTAQGSEPAAMDYRGRTTAPAQPKVTPVSKNTKARAVDQLRTMLEDLDDD